MSFMEILISSQNILQNVSYLLCKITRRAIKVTLSMFPTSLYKGILIKNCKIQQVSLYFAGGILFLEVQAETDSCIA